MNADVAAQLAFDQLRRKGFSALSEKEKTLATVWRFDAEVSNDSLEAYYRSKAANLAFYAPEAFRNIGAVLLAGIAEQANQVFGPEGPPTDLEVRRERVRSFDDQVKQKLERLDAQYYDAEEDVDKLLELYANKPGQKTSSAA